MREECAKATVHRRKARRKNVETATLRRSRRLDGKAPVYNEQALLREAFFTKRPRRRRRTSASVVLLFNVTLEFRFDQRRDLQRKTC